MDILYLSFQSLIDGNTVMNLKEMGHHVDIFHITSSISDFLEPNLCELIEKKIDENHYDCAFSYNFGVTGATACHRKGLMYISWVYDSPCESLYSESIFYDTNRVFIFDSSVVSDLKAKGVQNVFYHPLGYNQHVLETFQYTEKERERYQSDISFVGSLYENCTGVYDTLSEVSKDRNVIGYLDGLMEVQRRVYGIDVIQDSLNDEIIRKIENTVRCSIEKTSIHTKQYMFATHGCCKKIASIDRIETLYRLSQNHTIDLYTNSKEYNLGKCNNHGPAHYDLDGPKIFYYSKINLNMTLRSIYSGIPLRAIDIMGAGGFLISNYQEDFLRHFEPDQDFVSYESYEELEDKVDFYLRNDTLRKKIAESGQRRVLDQLEYKMLLNQIFKLAGVV